VAISGTNLLSSSSCWYLFENVVEGGITLNCCCLFTESGGGRQRLRVVCDGLTPGAVERRRRADFLRTGVLPRLSTRGLCRPSASSCVRLRPRAQRKHAAVSTSQRRPGSKLVPARGPQCSTCRDQGRQLHAHMMSHRCRNIVTRQTELRQSSGSADKKTYTV